MYVMLQEVFKNARRHLKDKDARVNKRGQLQSIALARIEQDVKRVGKMVAVMPTSGDELLKVC